MRRTVEPTKTVRKCQEGYLNCKFTFRGPGNRLECVVCGANLSDDYVMVPGKLKRHWKPNLSGKDKNYLNRLFSSEEKQAKVMVWTAYIYEKA